ncbi:MAG: cytochrome c1 [Rickettsiales bacterium]
MRLISALLVTLALTPSLALANATDVKHPKEVPWVFNGMTGHLDRQAIQRGFQVYKEVCSACHGLHRVAIRSLQDVGFSEAEVKALAAGYTIQDGPNDEGDMFDRPGLPSDHFPSPFANEQAARAANSGAYPPDLSLIVKARHDGANYVYSLLTGYTDPPAGYELAEGKHYNPYFPTGGISMPPPLTGDGQITYEDGTSATVDQMARDVVNFLQWAAEPEMEQRKMMGIKVLIFLGLTSVLFYFAKRRVWQNIH